MPVPSKADILDRLTQPDIRLGEIKKLGKEIKCDHALAEALWSGGTCNGRLLACLIFDTARLDAAALARMADELLTHDVAQRNQIADWLLANQLMKSARTRRLIRSWQHAPSDVLRRLFWYHKARLRWTGQNSPDNTEVLLEHIEKDLANESSEVQWAMNFCAGWIGIYNPDLRERCIRLGETLGLYRDVPVRKNCTPDYLPEFIRIEVAKRAPG